MNTVDQYLQNSNQNCKATTREKKEKKKIKLNKQERNWTQAGERFTQDPNSVWLCPQISYITKAVFHVILMYNPSHPSANLISEVLKMHKDDVLCSIYELMARKILTRESCGTGHRSNLYLVNMDPSEWDLASNTMDLIWEDRAVIRKLRFSKGKKKADFKNMSVPMGGQQNSSGPNGGPTSDISGPNGGPTSDLAVPMGGHIYINPQTNGEINIYTKKEGEGLAPLDGPSTKEEENPLLIIGHGQSGHMLFFRGFKQKPKSSNLQNRSINLSLEKVYQSLML